MRRQALVTGATRGIGFEIARQLALSGIGTLLGARDEAKGVLAAEKLVALNAVVTPVVLDVAATDIMPDRLIEIERKHGPIDILINNAGILIDTPRGFSSSLFELSDETMRQTWVTNVLGPTALTRALLPGMMARGYGRIVNISSRAGQLSDMHFGFPAYRMSKAALNALTRISAAEATAKAPSADIKINAVCPGWVKTEMGGAGATRSVVEGAETPVWLAKMPAAGPTGEFFHDKSPVAW